MTPGLLIPLVAILASFGVAFWAFWWGRTARLSMIWGVVMAPPLALFLALLFLQDALEESAFGVLGGYPLDSIFGAMAALSALVLGPPAGLLGFAASHLILPTGHGRDRHASLNLAAEKARCSPLWAKAARAGAWWVILLAGGCSLLGFVASRSLEQSGKQVGNPALDWAVSGLLVGALLGVAEALVGSCLDLRWAVRKAEPLQGDSEG